MLFLWYLASVLKTYMSHNLAVFITILYWSLLYEGGKAPSYINLYVHGLQASELLKSEWDDFIGMIYRVCLFFLTNGFPTENGILRNYGQASHSPLFMSLSMLCIGLLEEKILMVSLTKDDLYYLYSWNTFAGNPYVYSVLDWENEPIEAVEVLALGVVCVPIIHSCLWFITFLRNFIHSKLFPSETQTSTSVTGYYNSTNTITV